MWLSMTGIFKPEPLPAKPKGSRACGCESVLPFACVKAQSWHEMRSRRDLNVEYQKMKQTYKSLCSFKIDKDSEA
jgi:hypothetical protein